MKILHISTSDTGGAGIAALRLHQSMLNYGLESKFLCLEKTTNVPEIEVFPKFYPRFYHRFLERFGIHLTQGQKNEHLLKKINSYIDPEMYSFLRSDYRIHEHSMCDWADVIIIHWVAGFLDYKSFFNEVPKIKKVFWYAHDFSLLLGGFHTLFDSQRFKGSQISTFEAGLKKKKRDYLKSFKDLQIIANSRFTYNTIIHEGIFKLDNIHCVPLGLPETELNPIGKTNSKQAIGLKKENFVVVLSAAKLSSPLKGLDRFEKIIEAVITQIPQLKVILLGDYDQNDKFYDKIFYPIGSVWQPQFKQIIFSAADVVISTSYEETFGQTIIEGYACGTPSLVFNNAALPELIISGKTGYLADNIVEFSNHLIQLASNRTHTADMGKEAFKLFKEKYTSKRQVKSLLKLFETTKQTVS